MKKTNEKQSYEPYIGSVRFFRHLILTVLFLMILIPVVTSILFGLDNRKIKKRFEEEQSLVLQQSDKIIELQQELTEKQMEEPGEPVSVGEGQWEMILVNDSRILPYDFEVSLVSVGDNQNVDERIAPMLENMLRDAESEGVLLKVVSSYRDLETQQNLFTDSVNRLLAEGSSYKDAFYRTRQNIAMPGKSEYQTGLCVDIIPAFAGSVDEAVSDSSEMMWLRDNCYRYGFILRYLEGKTEITGMEFKPYCFRYIGRTAAEEVMKKGITLEEYLGVQLGDEE